MIENDGHTPAAYRSLPVEVDAIRWTGDNTEAVIDFCRAEPVAPHFVGAERAYTQHSPIGPLLRLHHEVLFVLETTPIGDSTDTVSWSDHQPGVWVVKDGSGRLSVLGHEPFERLYRAATYVGSRPLDWCYPEHATMTRDELAEALNNELADIFALVDNVCEVYMHVTGGRFSKPFTDPSAIKAEADEYTQRLVDEAVEEARTCP